MRYLMLKPLKVNDTKRITREELVKGVCLDIRATK